MATAEGVRDKGQGLDGVVIEEGDLWGDGDSGEMDEESERDSVVTKTCIGELLGFFSSQNFKTSSSDRRVGGWTGGNLKTGLCLYGLLWRAVAKCVSVFGVCIRVCVCLYE